MDSKKKMIISISAVAMVILAAVVAVVAVLAAQQVTIKSSVNISYEAGANVIGTVGGTVTTQNNANFKTFTTQTFTGNDENETNTEHRTDDIGNITFVKDTNTWAEFNFTFTNASTVANYTATLSLKNADGTANGTLSNMKIYTKTTGSYALTSSVDLSNLGSITVNKNNGTGSFSLKVELNDDKADASFVGNLHWNLVAERA